MSWFVWIVLLWSEVVHDEHLGYLHLDKSIWHISIWKVAATLITDQQHPGLVPFYRYIAMLRWFISFCSDGYTTFFILAFNIAYTEPLQSSYLLVFCQYLPLQTYILMLNCLYLDISSLEGWLMLSLYLYNSSIEPTWHYVLSVWHLSDFALSFQEFTMTKRAMVSEMNVLWASSSGGSVLTIFPSACRKTQGFISSSSKLVVNLWYRLSLNIYFDEPI